MPTVENKFPIVKFFDMFMLLVSTEATPISANDRLPTSSSRSVGLPTKPARGTKPANQNQCSEQTLLTRRADEGSHRTDTPVGDSIAGTLAGASGERESSAHSKKAHHGRDLAVGQRKITPPSCRGRELGDRADLADHQFKCLCKNPNVPLPLIVCGPMKTSMAHRSPMPSLASYR